MKAAVFAPVILIVLIAVAVEGIATQNLIRYSASRKTAVPGMTVERSGTKNWTKLSCRICNNHPFADSQ